MVDAASASTYATAPVPSRATVEVAESPSRARRSARPGMNPPHVRPGGAEGRASRAARTAEDASRRQRIGSVEAPVGARRGWRPPRAAVAAVATGRGRESYAVRRSAGSAPRVRSPSSRSSRCRRQSRSGWAIDATGRHQRPDVVDRRRRAQDPGGLRAVDEPGGRGASSSARGLAVVHDGRAEADERVAQPGVGGHDLGVARAGRRRRTPTGPRSRAPADVLVVTRNFSATSASISASLVGKWR